MSVSSKHPDYKDNLLLWQTVRDCVAGSKAIKSKSTDYLPMPNASDRSPENKARYDSYLARANYVNFTGQTHNGLLGMVYRAEPVAELPPDLEYMIDDATGNGVPLDDFSRAVVSEMLLTHRAGILVDYPETSEGPLTRAEVAAAQLRANLLLYPAESIINWRMTKIGGVMKWSLIVLVEYVEAVDPDGFGSTTDKQYRVLRLENGNYIQEIYDSEERLINVIEPRDGFGDPWKEIPFAFAPAGQSPLLDIAEVNLAHYRNSAEFEDSCYLAGQPTPYFSGLSMSWVKEQMKGGVMLGSRTAVLLPVGAAAGLLQANPNPLAQVGMQDKENQLMKIGARIIQDARGNETENAARMRFAGQTSPLSVIVAQAETLIEKALAWAAQYMGTSDAGEFDLNKEFYESRLDPQEVSASMMLLDRGIIATTDVRAMMRENGTLDANRTDDEIDADLDNNIM